MELQRSSDLAYVMSNLIVGDGGVYSFIQKDKRHKAGQYRVYQVLMTSVDREYVDSFNRKICFLLKKKRLAKVGIVKSSKYRVGNSDLWRIQVSCSKEFYNWVKTCSKEYLMELWRQYPHEFLQSWFDSDGTVYRHNGGMTLELTNSKKDWLIFAQQLLKERFGIELALYFNQRLESGKNQWQLQTGNREMIYRFFKHIGFGIIRKQRTLTQIEYLMRGHNQ